MLIISFFADLFSWEVSYFKIYTQLQFNGLYPTGTVIYVYIVEPSNYYLSWNESDLFQYWNVKCRIDLRKF